MRFLSPHMNGCADTGDPREKWHTCPGHWLSEHCRTPSVRRPSEPECQIQTESPAASGAATGPGRRMLSCWRIRGTPGNKMDDKRISSEVEMLLR